ncbi:hypothetical protein ACXWR7_13955, partial [Streptococcus pyogenes]
LFFPLPPFPFLFLPFSLPLFSSLLLLPPSLPLFLFSSSLAFPFLFFFPCLPLRLPLLSFLFPLFSPFLLLFPSPLL